MKSLPNILTANTYFWASSSTANGRRKNEERNISTVVSFFPELGFDVSHDNDTVKATNGTINVRFHYSESCKNVYKSLEVTKNGKRSNITAIKKLLAN